MMKRLALIIAALGLGFVFYRFFLQTKNPSPTPIKTAVTETQKASIVAQNLDTPWSLVFLSDGSILITERPGRVRIINKNGRLDPKPIATLKQVTEIGEGGLLGMALHPNFQNNHFIYLYYTYRNGNGNLNRVVRMKYENRILTDEKIIVDDIPAQQYHDGGRIKFGPDKNLYIGTGDAQDSNKAQDRNSLSGKILRVTDDGKPVQGNPFNNLVYSYGHRNVQGLAWDGSGRLFATEHGRSGVLSGLDEFNLIQAGKNYGWPLVEGDKTKEGMTAPLLNSGPATTWAPAGMAFYKGAFYFGGLKGSALYKIVINNLKPQITEYLKDEYGRIRDVELGPDNMLYITTSNEDGRGIPKPGDDKVVRIDPERL